MVLVVLVVGLMLAVVVVVVVATMGTAAMTMGMTTTGVSATVCSTIIDAGRLNAPWRINEACWRDVPATPLRFFVWSACSPLLTAPPMTP